MEIRFRCFECGNKLKADEDAAGVESDCPHCGATITVPQTSTKTTEILRRKLDEALTNTDGKGTFNAVETRQITIARPVAKENIPRAEPLADAIETFSPDQLFQDSADEPAQPEPAGKSAVPKAKPVSTGQKAEPTAYRAGTKVGNFEIGYLLGAGSMGQVFLAKQISMDRKVALKILPPEIMNQDDEAREQFMNEVRVLAKLEHPNIVTAFEAGEENGVYFLAMSYVNGESLERRLQRDRMLPEEDALRIAIKVAQALQYAWDRFSLLHQDVKPANIMIEQAGEVKLMDMGIAKISSDEEGTSMFVMGTPYYMSPEQASGRLDLDWRSDQYALGCTLYHLLTGQYPYIGDEPSEVMKKHFSEPLTPPKQVNPDLSEGTNKLVKRMMAKAADRRYESWAEVIKAMQDITKELSARNRKRKAQPARNKPAPTRRRRPNRSARYQAVKGPSPIAMIGGLLGIIFAFYLILSIINKSGALEGMNLRFPQQIFLPPFRIKEDGAKMEKSGHHHYVTGAGRNITNRG